MTAIACQRWHEQMPLWTLTDPGDRFDHRRYEVHPISETAARAFIIEHHYSGSYPAAKFRHGLYRAGHLVGVAVHSVPTQATVLSGPLPDLEPYTESVELGRFVLLDPEPGNAESWFLARVHEQLLNAGVRGVVSFSDPMPRRRADGTTVMPGHVGVIYQASNAVYTGRGTARLVTLLPDGSVLSDRTAQKIRRQERGHEYAERRLIALGARPPRAGQRPADWLRQALDDIGARRTHHHGNHRYVFRLGRNRRQREEIRIAFDPLPYPKQVDDGPIL